MSISSSYQASDGPAWGRKRVTRPRPPSFSQVLSFVRLLSQLLAPVTLDISVDTVDSVPGDCHLHCRFSHNSLVGRRLFASTQKDNGVVEDLKYFLHWGILADLLGIIFAALESGFQLMLCATICDIAIGVCGWWRIVCFIPFHLCKCCEPQSSLISDSE